MWWIVYYRNERDENGKWILDYFENFKKRKVSYRQFLSNNTCFYKLRKEAVGKNIILVQSKNKLPPIIISDDEIKKMKKIDYGIYLY